MGLVHSLPPFSSLSLTLERVSAQYKACYQEAEVEYNASKNRFPDKLPSEYIPCNVCVLV